MDKHNIRKESIKLILEGIKSIRDHLEKSKKMDYDFRQDIKQDLEVIETEVESWT